MTGSLSPALRGYAALGDVQAVIFDLEGTLYTGAQAVPGAVAALDRLRVAGLDLRFLTNTTSAGHRALADKLAGFGFEVEPDEVYCSPTAAAAFLRSHRASAWPLVQPAALDDFAGIEIDDESPDYVVIGDLGDAWSYESLNRAFRMVHERGSGIIGLVRSRFWRAGDGLRLDAGPFVAALEYATGKTARCFGKPEPGIFEAVLATLDVPAERVAMVGDDPLTDIEAAAALGMRTVLVRTGKYQDGEPTTSELPGAVRIVADLVIDSVADLA